MILFNRAPYCGTEERYIAEAIRGGKICGDGPFTKQCNAWLEERFSAQKVLLTTSGTTALDMAFLLCGLRPGDEVILPSFTFSSTATAAVLAGAKLVFVDVRPDTMNIDETKIEAAITDRTRVITVMHYAGVACEMDAVMDIARRHGLLVVEDAAQAVMSTYKGRALGTIGDLGCYSFHETKNYVMGEGGAIVLNEEQYLERAEIIREKGTNRRQVLKGWVDKYTWHDIGSSYLPSDLLAAVLSAQLERYEEILRKRLTVWNTYHEQLEPLEREGKLRRAIVPEDVEHNGHMYNIVLPTDEIRTRLVEELKKRDIMAYICYVPLHSSPMGLRLGWKPEDCPVTQAYGSRVLRLPLYADMTTEDTERVVNEIQRILTENLS